MVSSEILEIPCILLFSPSITCMLVSPALGATFWPVCIVIIIDHVPEPEPERQHGPQHGQRSPIRESAFGAKVFRYHYRVINQHRAHPHATVPTFWTHLSCAQSDVNACARLTQQCTGHTTQPSRAQKLRAQQPANCVRPAREHSAMVHSKFTRTICLSPP